MKKVLLLSVALLSLCGCGGKMCKPGGTQAQFQRDKYDCQMKTRSGSAEMMLVDLEHFQNCMNYEKGWSRCSE